jgi:RNA polymerase sigma-70 factor (ECF subfamily)
MNNSQGKELNSLALSVHRQAEGSVEQLVRCYQDQLFSFALRLLRDPMDAQEVTQDAFIRAIRALTIQYDAERCRNLALRPWLFRITRNLAFNRSRARHLIPEERLEPDSNGHKAALLRAEKLQRDPRPPRVTEALELALKLLNSENRALVLLRFMEEMSYAEIAALLGTTEAAARAKLFRALGKLRGILSRMEDRHAL